VEEQQRILCHSYNTSHRTRYFIAHLMVSVPWNTKTEMVLEMLVFSPLNQLTRLVAWEYFILQEALFQKLTYLYGSFVFVAKKRKIPSLTSIGTGKILWYTSSDGYSRDYRKWTECYICGIIISSSKFMYRVS
jgi:hypothetical protein